MTPVNRFLFPKLVLFGCTFWVHVSALFLALFSLFNKLFFRVQGDENSEQKNTTCLEVYNPMKPEAEFDETKSDSVDFNITKHDGETVTSKFFLKFTFRTYEEFSKINKENFDLVPSTSRSKYEFNSDNCISNFIEEPKDVNFTVKELYAGPKMDSFDEEEHNNCKDYEGKEGEAEIEQNRNDALRNIEFLSEKDFIAKNSYSNSIASSNESLFTSQFVGSSSEGFLSDRDFVDESDDEVSEEVEELEELEEFNVNVSSSKEFGTKDNEATSGMNASNKDSKVQLEFEDSNVLETLWEHQDLIEQLKMEIRKVRAIGLPTILEESESPKIMEDLKPWKIDEKLQHEYTMGELPKIYKSYWERMRKFDILSYQKMYTIGFLQSKDPPISISCLKFSSPGVTSRLYENLLQRKLKKSELNPMKQFIRDLHSDLEVVYVGQLCLSWEVLHWQYEKSLELWKSDPYGIRTYNEVASEFQQFHVLLQRFIENESFEGPRVQHYIKNRCILRNLLQVPVIREDCKKDKKARMESKDEYAITSDMLVEIMEESMRIFWRFFCADKDANIVIEKCQKGTQIQQQGASDRELLAQVTTSLQKKQKTLKEILRSGNCILRKFQKQQENSDQVLYFFSQVDMKLVTRVLNMTKVTTDQLIWCRNKLDKINFVNRKIHVEPIFLLFPC